MALSTLENESKKVLNSYTATQLHRRRWGVSKAFEKAQKQRAAATFSANPSKISAGKKLINTRNIYYREVDTILNESAECWRNNTRVYIEDGIRLVRNEALEALEEAIEYRNNRLTEAVQLMLSHWDEVKKEAKEDLRDLYNENDYPDDVASRYGIILEPVNINPPEHLSELNPRIYQEQLKRRDERIQASLVLHDQLMAVEFSKLVTHLGDVLKPSEDGKKKIFHYSSVENVHEFIAKFRRLSEGTDKELDELIGQAETILSAAKADGSLAPRTAEELRSNDYIRSQVQEGMSELQKHLDSLLVNPNRRVFSPAVEAAMKEVKDE